MSARTLTIFFPNTEVQYRFTDRVFVVGDKLKRDGLTWIVTSIAEPLGGGQHEAIIVSQDGDSLPSDGPP